VVWVAGEPDDVVRSRLRNAAVIHGLHEERVFLGLSLAAADVPGSAVVSAARYGAGEAQVHVRLDVRLLPPQARAPAAPALPCTRIPCPSRCTCAWTCACCRRRRVPRLLPYSAQPALAPYALRRFCLACAPAAPQAHMLLLPRFCPGHASATYASMHVWRPFWERPPAHGPLYTAG
jgi:hypothetical protein